MNKKAKKTKNYPLSRMKVLPNLMISRPNKPFSTFKYGELQEESDAFRKFMMISEKLKLIGEK